MGYLGKVGIRADIRWFKANSDTSFEGLTDRDRSLLDNDRTLVELSGIKYLAIQSGRGVPLVAHS